MDKDVQNLVEKFASDLESLIRSRLSEKVHGAVSVALDERAAVPRRNGKASGTSRRAPKGGRRSPEQIEKQAQKLLAHIAKNPDQRSEQLAEAVGLSTKELVGPIKKLLGAKKIKASGKARGTTYKAVG
jgi:predicted HTH transcriptional regulator